ncbi:MAG: Rieske 2Fe-2S domain-containing protein [Pirellulales bacterium]
MSEFLFAAKVADVSDPGKILVEVADRLVALFHVEGKFYALDDVCTHDDGPLAEGELTGYEIACPRHGARFDIRTGRVVCMPATKPTIAHDVQVVGDDVRIRINEEPLMVTAESAAASSSAATAAQPASETGDKATGEDAAPNTGSQRVASSNQAEDVIRQELKKVIDPELFVNIVDLGLVYGVELTPAAAADAGPKLDVKIEMTLTSPACPAGPQIIAQAKDVLGRMETVGAVEVKLVMVPPWSPDKMTDEAKDQLGIF